MCKPECAGELREEVRQDLIAHLRDTRERERERERESEREREREREREKE